jgi:aryl-alcohol dehydrogenase-like predicted oxidoreductase
MNAPTATTHAQVHWPDRYVALFGAGAYDINNERAPDDFIPFEEQLRGLEKVVQAGKVRTERAVVVVVVVCVCVLTKKRKGKQAPE